MFDKDASMVVECLWRFVENGRIRVTSRDDGQQFGLPKPVDAAAKINTRLIGSIVDSVILRKGILDVEFQFNTGHVLQIIPESTGYEAWNLTCGSKQVIAVGGGELAIFNDDSANH